MVSRGKIVYYIDARDPDRPMPFDPHGAPTPAAMVPSAVGRMANQQDVAEVNKATSSRLKAEVIQQGMFLGLIGGLLLFGWVMAGKIFENAAG
jgi:hypothetical protein